VHKLRPEGMGWFKLPLLVWALYSTSIIQVLATPVLGITLLLLAVEHVLQVGIFDPALGGDPVLFQHFFWFYSHPAVYIMILPAIGVISESHSHVFSRKPIFGYRSSRSSDLDRPARLPRLGPPHVHERSVGARGHDLQRVDLQRGDPVGIKVFNWVATMYKGSIALKTPMLYASLHLILFAIGGLTGLFLGTLSTTSTCTTPTSSSRTSTT
jgi:cytochrome c oxidase subunit 1